MTFVVSLPNIYVWEIEMFGRGGKHTHTHTHTHTQFGRGSSTVV
jgi:hypothetical protein